MPYLGICLEMQIAAIEFARSVLVLDIEFACYVKVIKERATDFL
jgi:CTP synthase (UTP-ammonia lyase)